jgi:hypothetical protein
VLTQEGQITSVDEFPEFMDTTIFPHEVWIEAIILTTDLKV